MNILFTICGRAGSKGIKNKNVTLFLGKPLPFYTASVIDMYKKQNPNIQSDVVLNTDSDELIKLFKEKSNFDLDIIVRDKSLAGDTTSKVEVIRNCFQEMRKRKSRNYDIIIDLDITSPLRTVQDLENLICKKNSSDADVVFSVTDARRNPYFNMVKRTERGYERVIESIFNARQEAPEVFDMNASLYAYSPQFLESGRGIFEGKCDVIWMMDTAVLDLDHQSDLELMQVLAEYLFQQNENMSKVLRNMDNIMP